MKRKRIIKTIVIGLVAALIIFALFPYVFSFPDTGPIAVAAETETVQTAMNAMMEDKKITTVTPNDDTTGSPGVNTWTDLPEGPGAAALDGYLKENTTHFYYCWDSKGNVYAQNKKDGVRAEPKDAEKQRPCKKSPQYSS